jgi:predicted CXXCH cytochrome family protein
LARDKRTSGKENHQPATDGVGTRSAPNTPPVRSPSSGTWKFKWVAACAFLLVIGTGLVGFLFVEYKSIETLHSAAVAPVTFVGSEVCSGCHRAEADLWNTSQHKHAMQHASTKAVLGKFNDATFDYYGVRSRFFRNEGKFLVETDGPDGKLGVFEIKYTFGIDPLQQYLVEFPDGRLQALSIAWDSRSSEQGGQRWFHLYPNEDIKHDDVLHWTKLNQNWNFMCAECHSTGVQKKYDAATDRYATSWAELSVGCEACHGKGSRHVSWARDLKWGPWFRTNDNPTKGFVSSFNERGGVSWHPDPGTANPQRNIAPSALRKEVETCGLCHARRGAFSEDWRPGQSLSDTHVVSTLAAGLYHPDGQMRDEVYNYGSFKQSKMFAAGVTCSDCHEPHAAKLRASGDGVCLQCHASEKYQVATHTHHEGAAPAVSCASCHMPMSTYMEIDKRHDHSLRIPRPDISVKLGTPNACNDCHRDKKPDWAASAVEQWFGPTRKGFQNYAEAFSASRNGNADSAALLAAVATNPATPAIARASALSELHSRVSPANIELARAGVADPDPLVRMAALDMLEGIAGSRIWPIVSPLLSDSSRGVRIRAASVLADVSTPNQPANDREAFSRAAAEYVAAQRYNSDRPEARSALGNFYVRRGLTSEAEAEYKAGLRLSPRYAPGAINLADLYRQLGRDSDAEGVLRTAITASSQDPGLHHTLGLTLTRQKRSDEALMEFKLATELEPDRSRYAYVYAVALHSARRVEESMKVLKESVARHPEDRDSLLALVSFSRNAGDIGAALEYGEQLTRLAPNDRELKGLVEDLRSRLKK